MCMYSAHVTATDENFKPFPLEEEGNTQSRHASEQEKVFRHDPLATSEAWQFAKHLDAGAGI